MNKLLLLCTLFTLPILQSCNPGAPSQDSTIPNLPSTTDTIQIDTVVKPDEVELVVPLSEYEQTFIDSGLVDIESEIPGILVELKYSTTDNFVEYDLYGEMVKAYLRPEAAEKLKKAQELLQEEYPHYSLLIYDAARPHRVQYKMWEVLDVPYKRNYLSPPEKGSVHNYGFAVDLTIADSLGQALDMGTEFDFFGPLAQPKLESQFIASGELTEAQFTNRKLLRKVMQGAGFYPIRTEWWHFNALGSITVKSRYNILP